MKNVLTILSSNFFYFALTMLDFPYFAPHWQAGLEKHIEESADPFLKKIIENSCYFSI